MFQLSDGRVGRVSERGVDGGRAVDDGHGAEEIPQGDALQELADLERREAAICKYEKEKVK